MARSNKNETAGAVSKVAEGAGSAAKPSNTYVAQSTFSRMLIIDVISDPPNIVDDKKLAYWDAILKVSNINYASVLPRNTIIAQKIRDDTSKPMFVFPFFPSHLSLPCKPGETVWVMHENPEARFSDIAYWFCRVVEPHHVDDVNHTHAPRIQETSNFPSLKQRHNNGGASDAFYELRNGIAIAKGGDRQTKASSFYIPGPEDVFEKIVTETDAAKMMQYESIPRFKKRPGDVAFEGSNNTLVVLGTDRVGPVSSLKLNESQNDSVSPDPIPDDVSGGDSGSIDIVAGRGQAPATSGNTAATTTIAKSSGGAVGVLKKELNKEFDKLSPFEGDPDLRNDRSRVLVSQRTNVDRNFDLEAHNAEIKSTKVGEAHEFAATEGGNAAVVIKSDKVRVIARSDIELVVKGYKDDKSSSGRSVITEKNDPSEWASIVVTAEGSIVFKPSKKGYIKLGSEKADRAILCTSTPAMAVGGKVTSTPIIHPNAIINPGMATATVTIGDDFGKTSGTFASKILVDVDDATYPSASTAQGNQSAPANTSPAGNSTTSSSSGGSTQGSQSAAVVASLLSSPSKVQASALSREVRIPEGAILVRDPSNPDSINPLKTRGVLPSTTSPGSGDFGSLINSTSTGLTNSTSRIKPPPTNTLSQKARNDGIVPVSTMPEENPVPVSIIDKMRDQDTISSQIGGVVKSLDPRYNK
jgi:hypothetical protein